MPCQQYDLRMRNGVDGIAVTLTSDIGYLSEHNVLVSHRVRPDRVQI